MQLSITQRIKAIRESKGLTQALVAEALELDRANYNRLEKRGEKMTLEQIQSIADALGVSLGEVLGIESSTEEGETGRVKELEKRVKELSDELYYLKEWNKAEERSKEIIKKRIDAYISQLKIKIGIEYEVGKVTYRNRKTGEAVEFLMSDYKSSEEALSYEMKSMKKDWAKEFSFLLDELEEVNFQLASEDNFTGLLKILFTHHLLEDRELEEVVKMYDPLI